ncbi:ubiquitin-specific protease [Multifurca ochricompacta]|uniref:Ubiquitin carboxyl-terminal hydrolase n=1 Tax=Multifurca ochricompacta TaxID=376703 RepID=A0AAD4QJZ0_9AGAM|nr:ubiquitin-specific protease [Multifurca ochricompacta]
MTDEDDSASGWQLTESDPGVFTELLKSLGVPLIVDDLYSLDSASLAPLQPLRALIFLFKWLPGAGEPESTGGAYDNAFPGFFAHQVVQNACATLAVLNALGNIPDLTSGSELRELFSFTAGMDAQTRGLAFTSADWLRAAHNALSPPSAISLDGLGLPKSTEDAYHFIVYLPVFGSVYELDGLKQSPITHGPYEEGGEGWVARARGAIEARIDTYPPGSLEFSLLALRDDPLPALESQFAEAQAIGDAVRGADLAQRLSDEHAKREQWAFENSLRRHNYVGLIHSLALALAKAGRLDAAADGARTAMKKRIEGRRKKRQPMDED